MKTFAHLNKMVKRQLKSSISEDDGESNIVNENGKRPSDSINKDGKKRIKTKSLYRQPTANELNRLQETENLFNSNLFRLQVEEILQEVKVKEKTLKRFQEWFSTLKTHLLSIPESEIEYDLSEKSFAKQLKVKLPISKTLEKTKVMFKFKKFSDVEVVGSYSLGCSISSKLAVDLQITVPAEVYTKNDSINYKYHKKRAAYLAYIASHLANCDIVESIQYSFKSASETKPILIVKPNGKLGNHLSVHLHIVCDHEAFKLHRFSPSRNNVRESWILSVENQENAEIGPPTPNYNSSILSDLTNSVNREFLKQILMNCENLKQAVVLLKIWVRQRNLQVSGYVISMIVVYLVQTKRINNIMSSYQIVRNVWIALKASEWEKQGISLNKEQSTPSLEEFHKHFFMVFLDKTGYYNILWQMSKGTYFTLRRECGLAIEMLDNGKINSFIPIFMTPINVLVQFDHILKFNNFNTVKESILNRAAKSERINYGLDHFKLVSDTIYNLISRGLGERVDLILDIVEADFTWSVKKSLDKVKKEGYKENLSFGFILNPEKAMNLVDRGPPANLPEAEEFRAFWGDKSELRRFQDGSITEACVWSAHSLAARRALSAQLVDYLLQAKYDIPPSELFHINCQFDDMLVRKSSQCQQMEETALPVLQAFDELRRDVRALTQLPLDVSAVYGTSPVFSYCDPYPPLPSVNRDRYPRRRANTTLLKDAGNFIPEYTPASTAILELTHSGKWPGELNAFRCLKAAFHLQIAERLNKQYNLQTQAYDSYIDVHKNGFVFRLIIAHAKEVTLLRRDVEKGVVKYKESQESLKLQRETVLLPRLRGALHGLHQKYSAFGPTVCLFKRWLSCHLLSVLFPAEVTELLVAAIFVAAAPLVPPCTPSVGFLRVLQLLANKDWANEMIVLDFNDDMSREEIAKIEKRFSTREENAPYLFLATPYDGDSPAQWSRALSGAAAARARAMAGAALAHARRALWRREGDALQAFVPSLSGYDVLIRLLPDLVPFHTERLDAAPGRSRVRPQPESDELMPVVEFHPVNRYLDELKSAYGEWAVFFHDAYGGDTIAVLWTPAVREHTDMQIAHANALQPVIVDGETKYKVNIDAIVEDFKILGKGLVREVVVN